MIRIVVLISSLLLLTLSTIAQDSVTVAPSPDEVQLVEFATGFENPLFVTGAGDDSGRLFVVEQAGKIWIIQDGERLEVPFLDLSNIVSQDILSGYSERGLLGLAFHPEFADNGVFFVNYTSANGGTTYLARYQVSETDPNLADPASAKLLFILEQPFANHNGGHLEFDADGYLYMSLGDGGAANDPLGAGQDLTNILGTIIRIDVDSEATPYGIPDDNPFVDRPEVVPEIWAWGLRNPWRFSFDRATDDLYIGDVGQGLWEEINFESAESEGGVNYGWNAFEASNPFMSAQPPVDMAYPVAEYNHANGNCSVTGGYVYRGEEVPALQGVYLFGDFCSGQMWYLLSDENGEWSSDLFLNTGAQISSFGEDDAGELYLVDYRGRILKFVSVE